MKAAKRFFGDWGLAKVKDGRGGVVFATEIGSQIVLRPDAAKDLPSPAAPGANFREVVWGVSSKRHLDQIARELAKDRDVRADKDGTLHSRDDNGIGIGFRLWRHKKTLKPSRAPVNTPGKFERVDTPSRFYERASPLRMGHIVFFVPDIKAGEDFYTKRLGFRVSDRYVPSAGLFLRYAAESDHHNLFFIGRPNAPVELQHVAFEVRDVHEVFGGGINMQGLGWPVEVGPGRHPISSAYFWYFKSPCDGAVEYFCDSDHVTEKWKPTDYRVNRFSEWHVAEGVGAYVPDASRPGIAAT
jgi:catechol 2,3-dioxygenase-like lactoylglutathione lyase family enzyme